LRLSNFSGTLAFTYLGKERKKKERKKERKRKRERKVKQTKTKNISSKRGKAIPVTGHEGPQESHSRHGYLVCVCVYSVFVLFCV
jgi:hypothetical protein